nr:hypothetical protein GCM10020092_008020 [Actinoplanes digitatis]
MSAQRKLPQLCEKTLVGRPLTYWKKRVRNGTIRVSPVNSWYVRMACSIGMCGQKSGPLFRLVRRPVGPKKPSDAWVARTPSIQRLVSLMTRVSPVT